jgi:plasmid stabilization system protein ParE
MPQGDKSSYTAKQKRKAEHIEDSYRKRGVGKKTAEERAWRTVNKQDGGAKKKTSKRSKSTKSSSARKKSSGGRKRATKKSR